MIHPSYVELMKVVNNDVEIGEEPVVNSRYSIVIATAKRARQIIAGAEPMAEKATCPKPLSVALSVEEKCATALLPCRTNRKRKRELNEIIICIPWM